MTNRYDYVTLTAEVAFMIPLANGNSFILANGSSYGVVSMPLEGALALGPSLRVFDTGPFRRPGSGL